MADVFISYKREEITAAARVAQALSEEGFSVFFDLDDDGIHAGEEWDKRLEIELSAARCCVVLWSEASTASPNVRSEARRANDRGILVPAKIDFCRAPLGLDALQEADLRQWRGDRADAQWRFLVDRGIARKLGRPGRPPLPKATPQPQPARKPEKQDKHTQEATFPKWLVPAGTVATALIALLVWSPWKTPQSTSIEVQPSASTFEAPKTTPPEAVVATDRMERDNSDLEAASAARLESEAWEQAQRLNTEESYQNYLASHESGMNRAAASSAIAQLVSSRSIANTTWSGSLEQPETGYVFNWRLRFDAGGTGAVEYIGMSDGFVEEGRWSWQQTGNKVRIAIGEAHGEMTIQNGTMSGTWVTPSVPSAGGKLTLIADD